LEWGGAGNIKRQKKLLLEDLLVLDGLEEERGLCDEEKMRKDKAISELERITLLEEVSLRRKSRAL
jgi:hypothetical protein